MEPSVKTTEVVTDSWINTAVTGLPLKRHRATRRSKGFSTKMARVARDKSKKLEVAPDYEC